ncbi:SNF2 family N-terminal domain-containing protein [Crepidotus variabilis]|uniref:SNF2 family N-terminal domain-containing protein n=1 Tax=Crepidotus variabilis TaxID=179855 RepID=A0A9P6EJC5_9AGAR|nr:SNF2 family N-terminal domain-containing protein [Crepidotus variabilis]
MNLDIESYRLKATRISSAESSQAPTSAASSPPPNALSEYGTSCANSEIGESPQETEYESTKEEDIELRPREATTVAFDDKETSERLEKLQRLLQQSSAYSNILKQRMDEEKEKQAARLEAAKEEQLKGKKRERPSSHSSPRGKRMKGALGDAILHQESSQQPDQDDSIFQQPALITGAKLKPYQLEGLQWMVSLDQNGISGILADEMGLGKTLQTIAFSAYLREHNNFKPFLIVCPLSVVHNWESEYQKFAPNIPTCVYHGSREERAELRRTVFPLPGGRSAAPPVASKSKPKSKSSRSKPPPPKRKRGASAKSKPEEHVADDGTSRRRSGKPKKHPVIIDSDSEAEGEGASTLKGRGMQVDKEAGPSKKPAIEDDFTAAFPVVLTTYDIIIRDRAFLQHYSWGYIVVDEGHRLKNLDCKLMKEIKKYPSAGRMILTGTPLHNNLAELWSLLNFILPDVFGDLETFQEWFNLPELQQSLPTDQSQEIITSLHAILKPFLLRRLKVDVEVNLPPKKEYVLYTPLSTRQREAYDKVLDGGLRNWLIAGGTANKDDPPKDEEVVKSEVPDSEEEGTTKLRTSKRIARHRKKAYDVDGDDDEYFEMLESGEVDERGLRVVQTKEEEEVEQRRQVKEHQARTKVRQVNNMKLQNAVMQLRKVCSHPFLFDWPIDPKTHAPVLGEELVSASGKMMVLDRLLRELFKRKHKVLIFSQFKIMLDIIQDPQLFLLSTRAGGLGINLTAADTVIFYDQDWNPQMDAQAQDRAHRIGQTRPVLIFRLVSAHTVETKIMQTAGEKRKLEALVIAKGKFKMPAAATTSLFSSSSTTRKESMAEMAASLLKLEGEKIEVVPNTKEGKKGVLSDEDLDLLLDRSPEIFEERGDGWAKDAGATWPKMLDSGETPAKLTHCTGKAVFAVYQAPVTEESGSALPVGELDGLLEAQDDE